MYHTQALILKKEEWNEADLLITALTERFGKIRLRAQGARKHGAKLQGHLEPGSLSDISFVVGRNGYRLTTARLYAYPLALGRSFWEQLQVLSAILRALDGNLLEERERAEALFATTSQTLSAVAAAGSAVALRRILVWFYARLLIFLGFFPASSSPEARSIPTLREFVQFPLTEISREDSDVAVLEAELAWLTTRLGEAVRMAVPVPFAVAAAGSVY